MQIKQAIISSGRPVKSQLAEATLPDADLVLVFAAVESLSSNELAEGLKASFPKAALAGCSTAGEIGTGGFQEHTAIVTAIQFSSTKVKVADAIVDTGDMSFSAGARLGAALSEPGLKGVLVFGKGLDINGSALIDGLVSKVGNAVSIAGGLAGDNGAFKRTLVLSPHGLSDRSVVAVGLYGDQIHFGHGSYGGWTPFGPVRRATKSDNNILYELDGEPALNVYKKYLGEYAKDLPASGLLFPFEMLDKDHSQVGLIRTILGVDEATGSLTLAGAIDPNGYLRLMHASPNALIEGAEKAAKASTESLGAATSGLALMVSCVGRKLVMGDQVDDEIAAVGEHLGKGFTLAGFYSYGEINPLIGVTDCKLHNQTMTIALLSES